VARSCCVAHSGLELGILLPLPLECWGHRHGHHALCPLQALGVGALAVNNRTGHHTFLGMLAQGETGPHLAWPVCLSSPCRGWLAWGLSREGDVLPGLRPVHMAVQLEQEQG
jgi:hypothetical protein